MAVGTSKARIVETLYNQIKWLVYQVRWVGAASFTNGRGRQWMLGYFSDNDSKAWNGDIHNVTQMKKAFDRNDLAVDMAKVMSRKEPGTTADKMAVRFQSDYLCAMDRAFRTRHTGHIRSEVHAAYRRFVTTPVVLNRTVLEYTQNLIARGQ
jgi:hypothetical protein